MAFGSVTNGTPGCNQSSPSSPGAPQFIQYLGSLKEAVTLLRKANALISVADELVESALDHLEDVFESMYPKEE